MRVKLRAQLTHCKSNGVLRPRSAALRHVPWRGMSRKQWRVGRADREHSKPMKKSLFAAALAAITLASAGAASAQDWRGEGWRRNAEITVRTSQGRAITAERGDRLFYRLLDRPYNFRPGMTYAYTDRCNARGCVVFVFDGRNRRPVDRIFAPHLQHRNYAWRQARDFDRNYDRYGRYDRDDRSWNNEAERNYRDDRDTRGDRDWDRGRDSRRGDGSGLRGGPL
jgi:hypothetical protein